MKIIKILFIFVVFLFNVTQIQALEYICVDIGYQGQENENWTDFSYGGALAGTENGVALDNLEIHLVDAPNGANIEYRVYTNDSWGTWVSGFENANTNGQDILGLQIQLTDYPHANVYYQTYQQGLSWGNWVKNGQSSGQLDATHPITGFRVQVDEVGVEYISNVGGTVQSIRHNKETQGTGLIYSIQMGLISSDQDDQIQYRAYFMNSGWSDWASNMTVLSSEHGGDVITALEAKLVGLDEYHVAIQSQVDGEWWDWAYDGQTAGTLDKPLTAYRVKIEREIIKTNSSTVITNTEDTSNGSISQSNKCPSSLGANELSIYSNDSEIIIDTNNIINLNQVRYEDTTFFFTLDSTSELQSLSAYLVDSNPSTLTFDSNDSIQVCFGTNIANDIGFDNKVYLLRDTSGDYTSFDYYKDNYINDPSLAWFWWLFDIGYLSDHYEIQEYNIFSVIG